MNLTKIEVILLLYLPQTITNVQCMLAIIGGLSTSMTFWLTL
jgi:hypothetical protein